MLEDIVQVELVAKHLVRLRFEDGIEGVVDLGQAIRFRGVFEPLRNERSFLRVHVLQVYGLIGWPSGAGLDPDALYPLGSESAPPEYEP